MKKNIIVIFGKINSGKDYLANKISLGYDVVFNINARKKNLLIDYSIFNGFQDDTDLIVIRDIPFHTFSTDIFYFFNEEITVNRQYKPIKSFKTPKIVVIIEDEISEDDVLKLGNSILRRCKFFLTYIRCDKNKDRIFEAALIEKPQIINKQHKDFDKLLSLISKEIELNRGCQHNFSSINEAFEQLANMVDYEIDSEGTINYMKSKGGYCDCEILMNVPFFEENNFQLSGKQIVKAIGNATKRPLTNSSLTDQQLANDLRK